MSGAFLLGNGIYWLWQGHPPSLELVIWSLVTFGILHAIDSMHWNSSVADLKEKVARLEANQ